MDTSLKIAVNLFSKKWEINGMDTGVKAVGIPHISFNEDSQTYNINGIDTKLRKDTIAKSETRGKNMHDNAGQIKINWTV